MTRSVMWIVLMLGLACQDTAMPTRLSSGAVRCSNILPACLEAHVDGERKKRVAHDSQGEAFGFELFIRVAALSKTPHESEGGRHLDEAVETESHESDAARDPSGSDGHHRFDHVPRDGEVFEDEGAANVVVPGFSTLRGHSFEDLITHRRSVYTGSDERAYVPMEKRR